MKKKIKIIDLLNKIANDEEVPKRIIYGLNKWFYDKDCNDYFKEDDESSISFQMTYVSNPKWLNIEVEILDEEDEFEDIETITSVENNAKELVRFADTINQLIYNQKKIIERLEHEKKC